MGRGAAVMATGPPTGLHLCDHVCGGAAFFRPPWLLETLSCSQQVHSCLPSGWQVGMGNCYYARKWNRLKLATFYHAFLWKLGAFNRLQFRSYCRQTLPAWLWCRWGGRSRVLLPRLPASAGFPDCRLSCAAYPFSKSRGEAFSVPLPQSESYALCMQRHRCWVSA